MLIRVGYYGRLSLALISGNLRQNPSGDKCTLIFIKILWENSGKTQVLSVRMSEGAQLSLSHTLINTQICTFSDFRRKFAFYKVGQIFFFRI